MVQFFKKFRFQLIQLLIISLLSAALSLAIPLYILIVYDRVVRALSSSMLFSFGGGVLIALIGIALLEKLRSNLMTYIGNQLDASTGREILDKVLSLPMTYLEQSPVGSQIARIKDYDSLRSVITGNLLTLLFDIPVAILFLFVVAFMGGNANLSSYLYRCSFYNIHTVILSAHQ
ncbi:hypothetical protein AYM02_01590 [Coxiella burnetii]|uniref:ABC transporter transmembrane domain-containing protein n=1 Tax=Coxiella burnetii TaxID=777 RepID=UPI0000DAE928|nr:ABC transporter transmembrane domain-containing protein [Coxiella burnetii]AML48063.1 hypothetical protein AUR58_01885 [Coxiella burnetii]AML54086.1 hypothetical protein AYM38_01565 [Coxiella burnetii]ATN68048.1 hypothetical protein AYM00_01615 [Coxiella burnetii]ATN69976.1 hypothetical protein AYM02_01590 [Coxiella burnetii]ATN71931.1 hypothetical protein AYM11_01540 [Coxiella burnetii]